MLVLTRGTGEKIYIGPDIVITLVQTQPGGKARIAVDAPRHIRIIREELLDDDEQTQTKIH